MIFWPGLHGPFQLDDLDNIPQAQVSSLSWRELSSVTFNNDSGPLGRPLSVLSFALNHYFTGPDAFGFKATNLALHLLNAVLLLWLGALLLRRLNAAGSDRTRLLVVAGVAALLWAIHPIQVSTVLYAVQRMAILASTFTVAAVLCYVVLRRRLESPHSSIVLPALLLGLFSLCAVLSKESGALIPFYILAVEFVVFQFRSVDDKAHFKLVAVLSAYVAAPIVIGIAYFFLHSETLLSDYEFRDYTVAERLLTQPGVLWFYIKLILLPNVADMSLFHDDYPIAEMGLVSLLQLAGIVGLALAAMLIRRWAPVIALGVLWFLASHLLESTVFPLELVFEHRNYLGAWGLLLPVAFYLVPGNVSYRNQKVRAGVAVALAALFAFQSQVRASTWSDIHLWTAVTVREHPNSSRAHHAYARLLTEIGKYAEAREEARAAERLNDGVVGYTVSVLLTECITGEFSAATLERLKHKLANRTLTRHTLLSLHNLLRISASKRCPELDRDVMLSIAQAAATDSSLADPPKRSAGLTLLALTQALFPDKQAQAIETLREAHPGLPENIIPLVVMQARNGQLDAARETLTQQHSRLH